MFECGCSNIYDDFYRMTDEIEALKAILLDNELNIKENDRYICSEYHRISQDTFIWNA